MKSVTTPFIVQIIQQGNIWIGICDELGLVTEANDYEQLTTDVHSLAKELYIDNQLGNNSKDLRLSFVHQDKPIHHKIAL